MTKIVAKFQVEAAIFQVEALLRAEGFSAMRLATGLSHSCRSRSKSTEHPQIEVPEPDAIETAGRIVQSAQQEWSIVVHAPFGRALRAIEILNASEAIEINEEFPRPYYSAGDILAASNRLNSEDENDTQPLDVPPIDELYYISSMIGLPLLLENAAPLSSLLGLPTLIRA